MKILIVTVYNTENCGSFLQAFALKKVLENFGHEVSFFYSPVGALTHKLSSHLKLSFHYIVGRQFKHAFNIILQYFKFDSVVKCLNVCYEKSDFYKSAELVILGSDTIWNFLSPNFKREVAIYWGEIFSCKRVISYAASAGNTPADLFIEIIKGGNRKTNISSFLLRDKHTQELVHLLGFNNTSLVCDPSLLLSPSDYSCFVKKYKHSNDCLILYCFDKIDETLKRDIIFYAKSRQLIIVSILAHIEWADYNVITSPDNMITYYSHAKAVVTDTFHGTVFSINYNLPFAVIDRKKIKVQEILQMYNGKHRIISDIHSLSEILSNKCDIENNCALEHKKRSLSLLINSIQ